MCLHHKQKQQQNLQLLMGMPYWAEVAASQIELESLQIASVDVLGSIVVGALWLMVGALGLMVGALGLMVSPLGLMDTL